MKHLYTLLLLFISYSISAQDSTHITVHVIYGSKPIAEEETKWFGGKLGGHIGLQVGKDKIIHFNPSGKVRAFGRSSEPGSYILSSVKEFYHIFHCDSAKRMQVTIPVSMETKHYLDSICGIFLKNPPYPYAFFGMRCAAACYHLLSVADVYPEYSKGKMIRRFFYPRKLRKRLIRSAKAGNWKLSITTGTIRRKWDHD